MYVSTAGNWTTFKYADEQCSEITNDRVLTEEFYTHQIQIFFYCFYLQICFARSFLHSL